MHLFSCLTGKLNKTRANYIFLFICVVVGKMGSGETSKSYGWTPCGVCGGGGKYGRHDNRTLYILPPLGINRRRFSS